MQQQGIVNGSDLLVFVVEGTGQAQTRKAIGHCTTHTATFNTETKDVAVKPDASVAQSASALYKSKRVTGLSVQVKCSGLVFYADEENGFKPMLGKWAAGAPVQLELMERKTGDSDTPSAYCSGAFIISSLENSAPAGEDATYDATFDNDGAVTIDTTKLDHSVSSGNSGGGGGTV